MSSRRPASRVATPVPAAKAENGSGDKAGGNHGGRGSVVLGPNDRLVGQLYVEGDLRVSGTVDGTLEATGDIEIAGAGKVSGAVTASQRLVVGSSAALIGGEVRVGRLTVEDGATFTGRVSMGQPAAPQAEPEPAAPAAPVAPVEEPVVVAKAAEPPSRSKRR